MAKTKRKLSAYNRHVQREMKKGKSMKAAARTWKKGGKRSTKSSRKPSRPKAKKRSGGTRKMGKKGGFNTQKVFKILRLAALAGPAVVALVEPGRPMDYKIKHALLKYTGMNLDTGQFNGAKLAEGWLPFLATTAVTYGIPKLTGILRGL